MARSKSALTRTNIAILGLADDFYDSFNTLGMIFEEEYNKMTVESEKESYTPTHWTVENNIRKKYRSVIEELFRMYSYIFIDSSSSLHAPAWAFKDYSLFRPDTNSHIPTPTYKRISFQEFLYDIHYRVTLLRYRWNQKNNKFSTFEDTFDEINQHILFEVEKSKHKAIISDRKSIIINEQPLYIIKVLSFTSCYKHNHPVVPAIFYALKVDNSEAIALPTHYCRYCKKYLIGQETLSVYDNSFGKTLVERYKDELENSNYSSFHTESKLHQLGYNVIDGKLSEVERHDLLIAILTNRKLRYLDICHTIEQNIRLFDGIPKYKLAVIKWSNDLKYLGDYIISHPEFK